MGRERTNKRIDRTFPTLEKERRKKRLYSLLDSTPIEYLLHAVWQIRQLQSENSCTTNFFYRIPQEWRVTKPGERFFFYQWRLETLINVRLERHKNSPLLPFRLLNLKEPNSFLLLWDALHRFENSLDKISLKNHDVFEEMFRLTRRQFEWQQGFSNAQRWLLYCTIFHGKECKKAFFEKHEVELDLFVKFGFAVVAVLSNSFRIAKSSDFKVFGISDSIRDKCWMILSASVDRISEECVELRRNFGDSVYAPSILRNRPCISFGDYLVAPLTECIHSRVTDGIYYDVIKSGAARSEFGNLLEEHVLQMLQLFPSGFKIYPEFSYGSPVKHSPDVFIAQADKLRLVMEIKASRLTARSRFSSAPTTEVPDDFESVAKGCVQLWRYVSDSSKGLFPRNLTIEPSTVLILACLDRWVGPEIFKENSLLEMANRLADKQGISRDIQIRRKIVFCTVDDIEYILAKGDLCSFVETSGFANNGNYQGWLLSSVFDEKFKASSRNESQLAAVWDRLKVKLPWLKELDS